MSKTIHTIRYKDSPAFHELWETVQKRLDRVLSMAYDGARTYADVRDSINGAIEALQNMRNDVHSYSGQTYKHKE
jgi:hypothetical protein